MQLKEEYGTTRGQSRGEDALLPGKLRRSRYSSCWSREQLTGVSRPETQSP